MGIVERRTDLVVRLGETRWQIVKPARGNRLADRAAIYPAIVLAAAAWGEGEELAEAIEGEESAPAIAAEDLVEVEQIAWGAGMFHAAAAETGMPSGADPEGTADQAHAPAVAEVPPAWDLEVVAAAAVAAAVDGGGRHGRRT
jgi:hypothetical protein